MALFKRFCACAGALQQRKVTSQRSARTFGVMAAFIMSGALFGLIVPIFGWSSATTRKHAHRERATHETIR
jgi:hypothetical protein